MKIRPSSTRPTVKIGDQPLAFVPGTPFGSLVTNAQGAKFGTTLIAKIGGAR